MVGEAAEAVAALLPSCEKGFSYKISFHLISSPLLKEVISIVKKEQQFPGGPVSQLGLRGGHRAGCGCCAGCWWPGGGGSVSALSHSLAASAAVCALCHLLGSGTAASELRSRRPTKSVENSNHLYCEFLGVILEYNFRRV